MSDADQPSPGTEDGADFFVKTSSDDGLTWSAPTLIASGAHFPGLLTLTDTTFLAMWRGDISTAGSLLAQQYQLS